MKPNSLPQYILFKPNRFQKKWKNNSQNIQHLDFAMDIVFT